MKGTVEKYAIGVPNGLYGEAEKLLRLDEQERVIDETPSEMELTASEAGGPVTMPGIFDLCIPRRQRQKFGPKRLLISREWWKCPFEKIEFPRERKHFENGSINILVLPEDQDRALEIVREIRDGTPLT
jgi:hypothetical protein